MTKSELHTALSAVCKAYYGRAPVGARLPYAVYTWNHDNFAADDSVYQKFASVTVNLYATDPDTEKQLDNALDGLGIFWNSTSSFEVSDEAYLTIYTMEVLDNE